MWRGRKLAIVIPVYNESRQIVRMLRELPLWLDWIIVVDDASDDDTLALVQALNLPNLQLLRHKNNHGVGAATVTGYRHALKLGAEYIIGSNGDGQMNPQDIDALLQALASGADLVRGDRFARLQSVQSMPKLRRLAIPMLSILTRMATGTEAVHDSQCGYHALERSALQKMKIDSLWPRYGFPNDLVARAAEAQLNIAEVPVDTRYGDEQSGIRPWHVLHPVGTVIVRAALRRLHGQLRSAAFVLMTERES